MPKLILTCDNDGKELECYGGYLNNDEDSAIVIYFCPECNNYYISTDGNFSNGTWSILNSDEASKVQEQFLGNVEITNNSGKNNYDKWDEDEDTDIEEEEEEEE